jgi:RNA polymerase sigma-70 factor (ECF subfamily)
VPISSVKDTATPVPSATQYGVPHSEDRVLVERFQAGDPEAFAELYRLHHPRVIGFVLQRVNDRHLAEDLAAETFTRALAALPQLNYCGPGLAGWLITIARNLITDHFRFSRTRPVSPAPWPVLELVDERNAEAAPEATAVGRAWLFAAITELEPRLREVVVRRVLLDRSVVQTAAELGCHESVVKHRLRRALRKLALLLPVEVAVV